MALTTAFEIIITPNVLLEGLLQVATLALVLKLLEVHLALGQHLEKVIEVWTAEFMTDV